MRISHDPDMDHWTQVLGALSTAIKHRSGYKRNMHVLEITLDNGFSRDAMEKTAAFVQVAQMSGFVSILKAAPQIAKDLGADGVLLSDAPTIAAARTLLGQDAIIGLACEERTDTVKSAVQNGADYVTIGTGANLPAPDLLKTALQEQSDLVVAALGSFTPDSAPFYAQGGASFVDGTYYIGSYDKGPMQAAVNLLHAIKPIT